MEHRPGLVHPESPNRIRSLYRLVDKEFKDLVTFIEPESATLEQLELVHTPKYIKQIMSTAGKDFTTLAPDTPVSANSYIAAWLAVGGCIKALQALMEGRFRACFCLVRPPGHHALMDRAGGFCIFNNLGVTAKYAMETYDLKRILIIDWDIHHGNALQDLFYRDNRVLYFSSHYRGWYPHTGDWEEFGEAEGVGYNVNLPVPKEMTDNDIIHIYRELVGRIVRKWKPELILIAAGFDAHEKDPLGRTRLSENAYGWLMQMILQFSDAKGAPILLSLEGGYDLWALVSSVREVLRVLTFEGRRNRIPVVKTKAGSELVAKALHLHEKFGIWAS
jgi:acetoin utilization deacetylase AcuC-like enzyme